ncbi:hypothetical protein ACFWZ2_23425 [Streptomyces sp. NPDC059002]|uniref:hypothetical protein n=1 Tax=Streptomyces sp. NPDC059002 TaxID=3346690 RepID=UPI0036BD8E8E
MTDLTNIGIECSEDWVPFPVTDTLDLDYWAEQQGHELVARYERDGERGDARRLSRDLKRAASDSRTREPLAAFGWYLSGHPTVAAILELDAVLPDDTVPVITLPWLTEHLSASDFGEPDVRDVRLPLGEAVRIRQNLIGGKKRLLGPRPVIRTLIHGIRPTGADGALTMYVSWTEPVLDETLEQIVDGMAQTLSL